MHAFFLLKKKKQKDKSRHTTYRGRERERDFLWTDLMGEYALELDRLLGANA